MPQAQVDSSSAWQCLPEPPFEFPGNVVSDSANFPAEPNICGGIQEMGSVAISWSNYS